MKSIEIFTEMLQLLRDTLGLVIYEQSDQALIDRLSNIQSQSFSDNSVEGYSS